MLLALEPQSHAGTSGRTARHHHRGNRALLATEPAAAALRWADRRPRPAGFDGWAGAVGQRLEDRGLAAVTGDLDELVTLARRLGVARVAADVLVDAAQPEPARYRAFAHVVAALVAAEAPRAS